jgi:hypothetical protein
VVSRLDAIGSSLPSYCKVDCNHSQAAATIETVPALQVSEQISHGFTRGNSGLVRPGAPYHLPPASSPVVSSSSTTLPFCAAEYLARSPAGWWALAEIEHVLERTRDEWRART